MFPFNTVIISTPTARKIHWADEDDHDDEPKVFEDLLSSALPSIPERESFWMNRSVKQLVDS